MNCGKLPCGCWLSFASLLFLLLLNGLLIGFKRFFFSLITSFILSLVIITKIWDLPHAYVMLILLELWIYCHKKSYFFHPSLSVNIFTSKTYDTFSYQCDYDVEIQFSRKIMNYFLPIIVKLCQVTRYYVTGTREPIKKCSIQIFEYFITPSVIKQNVLHWLTTRFDW